MRLPIAKPARIRTTISTRVSAEAARVAFAMWSAGTMCVRGFSSNVVTAIGSDNSSVKLVIGNFRIAARVCLQEGSMRSAKRHGDTRCLSSHFLAWRQFCQLRSSFRHPHKQLSKRVARTHFTIRMEIQDSDLRHLDDKKKLSSVAGVPMRWH
jgi:hypothetical protein